MSFGADTGAASSSGGSCGASTGAVAAAAAAPADSLSRRAGGVPPASYPSDPRHIHPMVTWRMTSQAVTLSATEGEPRVSPVPSSVRDALADPH